MDFREFATNYLNPIFLMYRAALLSTSIFILFISLPMFTSSATVTDMTIILAISLALAIGLYKLFRRRAYLLYLVIPLLLITIAFLIRGDQVVQEGVFRVPMAMWWASGLLIAFNSFRSWGYGVSMNEINDRISTKLNNLQK